jgi:hypothetical protein
LQEPKLEFGTIVTQREPSGGSRTHQDWYAAVEIIEEQNACNVVSGFNGAPDKPIAIDDRITDPQAVIAAKIDQRASDKWPARICDNLPGRVDKRWLFRRMQEFAQVSNLALQQLSPPPPLLQFFVFLGKTINFCHRVPMNPHVETRAIHSPTDFDGWYRRKLQEWRRQINELVSGILQGAMTHPAENQQNCAKEV